jgi:hypothetical protein
MNAMPVVMLHEIKIVIRSDDEVVHMFVVGAESKKRVIADKIPMAKINMTSISIMIVCVCFVLNISPHLGQVLFIVYPPCMNHMSCLSLPRGLRKVSCCQSL